MPKCMKTYMYPCVYRNLKMYRLCLRYGNSNENTLYISTKQNDCLTKSMEDVPLILLKALLK